MELSLFMRLRIAIAMAVGALLLGFLPWTLVQPAEPLGAITLFGGSISVSDAIACAILSYLATLVTYLVSHPYGRQLAPLAAPTGLAILAIRTGNMTSLLLTNHTFAQRKAIYATFRWEGFFWLAILAAGYLGLLTAEKIIKSKPTPSETAQNHNSIANKALIISTAIVITVIITQFVIGILAQDVRMLDSRLGSVTGQPSVGQIAFAVLVSFAIASFVVKKFFDAGYLIGAVCAALLTCFATMTCAKPDVLSYMVESWPAAYFSRAICAVLPLQMVAFGSLGSIVGYWAAVKYTYWRKHNK